jgi:hypothetical protein
MNSPPALGITARSEVALTTYFLAFLAAFLGAFAGFFADFFGEASFFGGDFLACLGFVAFGI